MQHCRSHLCRIQIERKRLEAQPSIHPCVPLLPPYPREVCLGTLHTQHTLSGKFTSKERRHSIRTKERCIVRWRPHRLCQELPNKERVSSSCSADIICMSGWAVNQSPVLCRQSTTYRSRRKLRLADTAARARGRKMREHHLNSQFVHLCVCLSYLP